MIFWTINLLLVNIDININEDENNNLNNDDNDNYNNNYKIITSFSYHGFQTSLILCELQKGYRAIHFQIYILCLNTRRHKGSDMFGGCDGRWRFEPGS